MDASAVLGAPGVASLCSGILSERCIRRAIPLGPEKAELSLLSFSILVLVLLLVSAVLDYGWREYVWELGIVCVVSFA